MARSKIWGVGLRGIAALFSRIQQGGGSSRRMLWKMPGPFLFADLITGTMDRWLRVET